MKQVTTIATPEKIKQTFHVATLLLGCGNVDNEIGTSLYEAASLRISLSQHRIQNKYFSINAPIDDSKSSRNLMQESARLARGTQDLLDLTKINVESYKALLIPPFMHLYDKKLLEKVYNISLIRSTISEFHLRKKYIVALGPSSINLVSKTLGIKLFPFPLPIQKEKFRMKYYDQDRILALPYMPKLLDDDPKYLAELHESIESCVIGMKFRVTNQK